MISKNRNDFTPDRPPRSGKAKLLWDWWIKHRGSPPEMLHLNRPGRWQRAAGVCHYAIAEGAHNYLVWDVEETLKMHPDEADFSLNSGGYCLA